MAFSDSVIDGGDIMLRVNGEIIACATSHTIELTNATREISCKGSGDFTSAEYGRFSWTVSTDALLNLGKDEDDYMDYTSLMDLMLNKAIVEIISDYDEASDSLIVQGEGIITSISKTAPDSDNASYSVSIQGRGDLEVLKGIRVAVPASFAVVAGAASGELDITWADSANELGYELEYAKVADGDAGWVSVDIAADVIAHTLTGLDLVEYKLRMRSKGDGAGLLDSKYTSTIRITVV